MKFKRKHHTNEELKAFYKALLLPRQIEEKMLIYLRQGKISKWFSGYGQEAVSVGCALAMDTEEYMMTMHRNLGVFTTRNIPLESLFAQFQGKEEGFTKGRDRSFHFGAKDYNIVGMISHLGPQLGIADGIALAELHDKTGRAALVFTGDGGASEGDFHEALNVAAVWDLPVIFVIENNQWGLSTPSNEQFRCKQFIDKGIGYGMEAVQVDGNNLLEVLHAVAKMKEEIKKNPKPYILECVTFRMRGHEEASGTKYYPEGLQEKWKPKDPVDNFEEFIIKEGVMTELEVENLKDQLKKEITVSFDTALKYEPVMVSKERELEDLYAPFEQHVAKPADATKEMRFVDAIAEAVDLAMEKHPSLTLMGQDIADYGGVFKVTDGLMAKYGKDRVRNTPLCESAILGAALGLSIKGKKAMMEMQFADFASTGFNQIVNNLAKIHWRWGQNADVVIRMPTGAGVGAGPFHSQSNEAWFFKTPGLKIVYPSSPEDAKGLLLAAFEDPNPVMFFEHKYLYRSLNGQVPEGYYTTEIGKAKIAKAGTDVTIITYGLGVHWAMDLATKHPGHSIEVIDLRTLVPLDFETVYASVNKTGKVLVLHEDTLTGGIGAEISARITEQCFENLDAPVRRCASLDTPVPFAAGLEKQFLATNDLETIFHELMEY
ncbi:MAG: dehydrogenase E1 component subunit alpha/beta [Salibacteraceae bacterium]|nr:dehydrogenase E1 component subunit alpha/beta [Salibacteraceae bacterium]MDP4687234.1 dehydrogenase E1 component subunit alpha/beta [Salibacteraceae bacterium]MDP4763388.1 dehydrogenase E1 component subunit alpha/beta [Salibacteraceae bacterium]MDP4933474.1 dehydrogenase E1 component subunit alpha/beta [Salibacteraceae bacterium]MDP4965782.1 dehydrogenase E1 component subunit alpha/beta [Salibacteraceae bacterium]